MTILKTTLVCLTLAVLIVGLLSPAYFDWRINKLLDEYDATFEDDR